MPGIKLKSFNWPSIARQREYINAFYKHLKTEFSTENLEFLVAELKAKGEADYRVIHNKYISHKSDSFINLPSGIYNDLNRAFDAGNWGEYKSALNKAVKDIAALIASDSWPRFCRTEAYGKIWMDNDKTDDKIFKVLKKVLAEKNIPILDKEGKKGAESQWSKLKDDLVPVRNALANEDISEFMEKWDDVKDRADTYVTKHKKKLMDSSDGKLRRETLEAIAAYHEMLEDIFTDIDT